MGGTTEAIFTKREMIFLQQNKKGESEGKKYENYDQTVCPLT
jgi:hypothetical protein